MIFYRFVLLIIIFFSWSSCNLPNKKGQEGSQLPVVTTRDTVIPDGHNSQNSIDWVGTYEGILPCADCEGIKTVIVLNNDLTFSRTNTYLKNGKEDSFDEKGNIEWNAGGNKITLLSGNERFQFQVGENKLFALDMDGNRIKGVLADHYILTKR